MLNDKNVALYVTGSIAAYKSLYLTRLLVKAGARVRVVMTTAAQAFVTPMSFQVLSKNQVLTSAFDSKTPTAVDHIELADWTDYAIVAPASADIIGKLANGIADDMASLTLMATTAPILLAPAMNEHMLNQPAVQHNLNTLTTNGVHFVAPGTGFLAEGYEGKGRMAEPDTILAELQLLSRPKTVFSGKNVLVTAGGTRERIDPVRFITNDSSGKMGYAIAAELVNRGANVTLISAPTRLTVPNGTHLVPVTTTEDLADAVVHHFPKADILVMAAAVADFRPKTSVDQKIKKTADNDEMTLSLVKTTDILKTAASLKQPGQLTVGFAAETQNLITNATKKLTSKQLDLLVANDVSQPGVGFNGDTNQVTILSRDKTPVQTALVSKTAVAATVVDELARLVDTKEG
ncbi:bifunctional phosphopantothenoylcysteine decarboxylase/phosphopantothenate--cysteine ligase CoaBC [Secundilactobacillus collinoides]|uniref:Coenzyme A biosynthesis bifunctional protein CoaBC n=3 Tax=Secundilactobacillus collinoides TaxID=33960 RepID=A0A0R2BDV1_SECCO|nr:bifunctional phosphopantothenoylcysteine decarboxylase/phosphopantothenate--cysteine ligase CoaBC [Secundilactobacillus collinoides]KRM77361.1 phosphopantothenoylcysteine synthetase decarboxylase [Secundilactobacillus collinoides DSM 20515 = JCM 1123]KZL40473.1 phosphopantothenoylcysteine decarboxylase [Secundilactobacillus collinoides]